MAVARTLSKCWAALAFTAALLAGCEGRRSGHGLNNALLHKLFSEPENYEEVMLA